MGDSVGGGSVGGSVGGGSVGGSVGIGEGATTSVFRGRGRRVSVGGISVRVGVAVAVSVAVAVGVKDAVAVGGAVDVMEGVMVHVGVGVGSVLFVAVASGLMVSVVPPVLGIKNSLSSAIGYLERLMMTGTMYAPIPITRRVI